MEDNKNQLLILCEKLFNFIVFIWSEITLFKIKNKGNNSYLHDT